MYHARDQSDDGQSNYHRSISTGCVPPCPLFSVIARLQWCRQRLSSQCRDTLYMSRPVLGNLEQHSDCNERNARVEIQEIHQCTSMQIHLALSSFCALVMGTVFGLGHAYHRIHSNSLDSKKQTGSIFLTRSYLAAVTFLCWTAIRLLGAMHLLIMFYAMKVAFRYG